MPSREGIGRIRFSGASKATETGTTKPTRPERHTIRHRSSCLAQRRLHRLHTRPVHSLLDLQRLSAKVLRDCPTIDGARRDKRHPQTLGLAVLASLEAEPSARVSLTGL